MEKGIHRSPDDFFPMNFLLPSREKRKLSEEIAELLYTKRESNLKDLYFFLYERELEKTPEVPWKTPKEGGPYEMAYEIYSASFSPPFSSVAAAFFSKNNFGGWVKVDLKAYCLALLLLDGKVEFEEAFRWNEEPDLEFLKERGKEGWKSVLGLGMCPEIPPQFSDDLHEVGVFSSPLEGFLREVERAERLATLEAAEQLLKTAEAFAPILPVESQLVRAQILYSRRKKEAAFHSLLEAFKKAPGEPLISEMLYDIFIDLGESERAEFFGNLALALEKRPSKKKALEEALRKGKRLGVFNF